MRPRRSRPALNERHERVSNLVWGLMFIGLGVLFGLHQTGTLDLLVAETPEDGERLTEHAAERVVDGDPGTRWSSEFDDDEWVRVDLGSSVEIDRVRLSWEAAHARVYEIQLSDDGEAWRTVVREEDGQGGVEEHAIGESGRYLQVVGLERATPYGISLWEIEALGPPEEGAADTETGPLLSGGRTATASSRERVLPGERYPLLLSFWFRWWPLFVIAAGLPHLLVPRSDGEELGGLVTVAVGVLFLLDNLDWTWREAAPVVLVMAGLAVLLQGLRKAGADDRAAPGDANGSSRR